MVGFAIWFYSYQFQETKQKKENLPEEKQIQQPTAATTTTSTLKIYRNKEFGFEFQYPADLIIRENAFKSYYSKFNLKIYKKIEEQFDPTFLVNVVLPEFAEQSYGGLEKTTDKVIVDGVSGIKYQYKFNERKETAIILPLNEYRLILGVYYEEYENVFNQIISTFKFLK
ncbi:MAG: hypothetical protein AAB757_00405 [Patescibacteria group bacterium]